MEYCIKLLKCLRLAIFCSLKEWKYIVSLLFARGRNIGERDSTFILQGGGMYYLLFNSPKVKLLKSCFILIYGALSSLTNIEHLPEEILLLSSVNALRAVFAS